MGFASVLFIFWSSISYFLSYASAVDWIPCGKIDESTFMLSVDQKCYWKLSIYDFEQFSELQKGLDRYDYNVLIRFAFTAMAEGKMKLIMILLDSGERFEWILRSSTVVRKEIYIGWPESFSGQPFVYVGFQSERNDSSIVRSSDSVHFSNISVDFAGPRRKFVLSDQKLPSEVLVEFNCSLLDAAEAVVLNKIVLYSNAHETVERNRQGTANIDGSFLPLAAAATVRVFCGIYTMEQHHDRVMAVKETWGRKCTSFLAFSTVEDLSIPAIFVPHLGEESYGNMWQKVRMVWKYVHKHYSAQFDFFLLGGDDMYYVMENLYGYLGSPHIQQLHLNRTPLYLGKAFLQPTQKVLFNSGGAGYLLNSHALEVLGERLQRDECSPYAASSQEDVYVAICLAGAVPAVLPHNTSDELGEERFHAFPPSHEFAERPRDGIYWADFADPNLRFGLACCSRWSVSFHYLSPQLMRDIDAYLHSNCSLEAHRFVPIVSS